MELSAYTYAIPGYRDTKNMDAGSDQVVSLNNALPVHVYRCTNPECRKVELAALLEGETPPSGRR
jgi:hypothetical protein